MKNYCVLFLLFTQLINGQNIFEVEKFPSRVRLSGEFINMHNEPDIGFLGHGYEVFGLIPKYRDLYFGVNAYSALTGIRSGFIVFGVSGGVQKYIYKDWFTCDLGLYLGGGGGSGAPDGGGLMIRPHIDLQIAISKSISLRTGINAITFPSGAINSLNVNIGAVINTNTYLINKASNLKVKSREKSVFSNIQLSATSLNLLNFKKGPLREDNPQDPSIISLVGMLLQTQQENNFFGVLKLGGAFAGGVDGFMMLLTGVGYQWPINKWLTLNTSFLAGGAGGGDVDFGGGLATQMELGLSVHVKDYLLQISGGNTFAPNGNFKSNHLDVSLGKSFKLYKSAHNVQKEIVTTDSFKKEGFNFSVFNRSYISKNRKDKNDRVYDAIFNLIGFQVEKNLNKKTNLIAATVWAYQGSYGAYAEGWLGVKRKLFSLSKNWDLNTSLLFGAGGGGGINLGSGLAYQYNIGIQKELNNRWTFVSNVGQVRPVLDGNFTPILVDIGVALNISQLVKN